MKNGIEHKKENSSPMLRIVSLIASSTEILCALGFEKNLIGRSHECDYPESIKSLPVLTEPKLEILAPSAEIDLRIKQILQEGLSIYKVDADKLRELKPDVVVTQTQCEVCAVSLKDVEAALCKWLSEYPRIVSLHPNVLADIWIDIEKVAAALGVTERGKQLVAHLKARMDKIAQKAQTVEFRPHVACIEWIDPLMAGGNWMPELTTMAGGVSTFGVPGRHEPYIMNWEQLKKKDPDIIVVLPCGFDIARTTNEMKVLTNRADWSSLKAVQTNRVYLADGNQYFNRPGPRIVESLEILAEILHPEVFQFGFEGKGWVRFDKI